MAALRSGFEFISSYCEGRFSVDKYQSKRTGMKFYHINMPLPLIKLEICVQTQPYDDTGCAHTLEHLIFMGSKKYPQQGYLDHIAAQYYSLGTNATTFRDMTTYELTTVNQQSIFTLLPIYLDHIFNPLLTKDCYLTEVHHISGETGEDAGVVYSEMQSSENQADEILLFSLLRNLWTDKESFYYESGGRLEAIRNELTLEKIKIFHQKCYTPKNVAVILCAGGLNVEPILTILNRFEEENFFEKSLYKEQQRKRLRINIDRNFELCPSIEIKRASFDTMSSSTDTITHSNHTTVDASKLSVHLSHVDGAQESSNGDSELMVSHGESSLTSSPVSSSLLNQENDSMLLGRQMNEYKEVFYPVEDDDENLGQVAFGYRLESIYNIELFTSLDVLLTTLFDEDVSIFYKHFMEIPNVLCSSINHDWFNYTERILMIVFEGVEVEKLTLVADKYASVLYSILNSSENNEQLLLQLRQNINKEIEYHLDEIEKEPFEYLTDLCCLDHISELSKTSTVKINSTTDEHKIDDDDDDDRFHQFLTRKKHLNRLLDRPISFWHDLIKKYLLEWDSSRRTIILLKPSHDLLLEQEEQEEHRIEHRRQSLGPKGLAKLREELNQARINNQRASSQFSEIEVQSIPLKNSIQLPLIEFVLNQNQIDLFHSPISQFNRYALHIPMTDLPSELQLYLPLFSNLLFHTAINDDEIHLSKFQFCQAMTKEILNWKSRFGRSSSSPIESNYVFGHDLDQLIINVQSSNDLETYQKTMQYISHAIFGTDLTDFNVILEECEKQLKQFIETLQDGETIHQEYFNCLIYANEKNHYFHRSNVFVQKNLFEKICKQPEKYKDDLLEKLQQIQRFFWKQLSKIHLTICGNIDQIRNQWTTIEMFLEKCRIQSQIEWNYQGREMDRVFSSAKTTIIGSPHEESGYVLRWTRLQIFQSDFVPLIILSNYLDMENGPLWAACRTNGYSYGVSFDFDFRTNLVLLAINQCSQLKMAYRSALKTLLDLVIDEKRIEAARNLTVCMLTESVATLGRATGISLSSYLNTYSIEKYQNLLNEVTNYQYNEAKMRMIIERYVVPLVNDDEQFSSTLILVNTNKMKETRDFLVKECRMSDVVLVKDIVQHLCR